MDAKQLSCIICKEPLVKAHSNRKQTSAIVCGHVFHSVCLRRWLSKCDETGRNRSCPNCRHPIQDEEADIIDKLYFDEDDAYDSPDGAGTSSNRTTNHDEDDGGQRQEQGIGFGGGLLVGAVVTALAFGIGMLFGGGGGGKRKK